MAIMGFCKYRVVEGLVQLELTEAISLAATKKVLTHYLLGLHLH
jgi:hypothetical protein